jgi:hypothetical protein
MIPPVRVAVVINLIAQALLLAAVLIAARLATKKRLKTHCNLMTVAVPVQILATTAVMLPSMLGYVRYGDPGSLFNIEIWVHHTLGLAVIALWIYMTLAFRRVIKVKHRLRKPMIVTFWLWLITLALGAHLYLTIWA